MGRRWWWGGGHQTESWFVDPGSHTYLKQSHKPRFRSITMSESFSFFFSRCTCAKGQARWHDADRLMATAPQGTLAGSNASYQVYNSKNSQLTFSSLHETNKSDRLCRAICEPICAGSSFLLEVLPSRIATNFCLVSAVASKQSCRGAFQMNLYWHLSTAEPESRSSCLFSYFLFFSTHTAWALLLNGSTTVRFKNRTVHGQSERDSSASSFGRTIKE